MSLLSKSLIRRNFSVAKTLDFLCRMGIDEYFLSRLAFEKEDEETTKIELARIRAEIEQLKGLTYVSKKFPNITFKFDIHASKFDQKIVCVDLEESGMMNCPCCGAKPSDVRDNKTEKFKCDPERCRVLSQLHFGINMGNNILKVIDSNMCNMYSVSTLVIAKFP